MKEPNENMELFQKALIEARLRKAQQIADEDKDEVVFSDEHRQKMRFILKSADQSRNKRRRLDHKRLIASLIGAAMVSVAAIAVFVNRDHILSFAEQSFIVLFQNDNEHSVDPPQKLDKVYSLSYVPEGFEIVSTAADLTSASTKWQNPANEEFIIFEQALKDNPDFIYDAEEGRHEKLPLGEFEIHCIYFETTSVFVWSFEDYAYKIECSNGLPFDEISQMILTFLSENF